MEVSGRDVILSTIPVFVLSDWRKPRKTCHPQVVSDLRFEHDPPEYESVVPTTRPWISVKIWRKWNRWIQSVVRCDVAVKGKGKGEIKFPLEESTKVQRGSRGIALLSP